jgi:hypothetical protein
MIEPAAMLADSQEITNGPLNVTEHWLAPIRLGDRGTSIPLLVCERETLGLAVIKMLTKNCHPCSGQF